MACEKYCEIHGKNIRVCGYPNFEFVQKPTLVSDDLAERALDLNKKNFVYSPWSKFIYRNFLLEKNLRFLNMMGEDALLTWCLVCSAKKYIRIPNVTYLYRIHDQSQFNRKDDVPNTIKKWMDALIQGFTYLDNFLNKIKFFQTHLEAKYLVLDALVKEFTAYFIPIYAQIPAYKLDKIIRQELENVQSNSALMAFLLSRMNVLSVHLIQREQTIQQLQAQFKQIKS